MKPAQLKIKKTDSIIKAIKTSATQIPCRSVTVTTAYATFVIKSRNSL